MKYCAYLLLILNCLFSTAAFSAKKVDKIVVYKSKRLMHLLEKDKFIKSYEIALGGDPKGHKQKQGDQKTPEGLYQINGRNPGSRYYKSLRISYPNTQDREVAKNLGLDPGGDIMIHGLPKNMSHIGCLHRLYDWTLGCIAVTNEEIDEIWQLVQNGTVIELKP